MDLSILDIAYKWNIQYVVFCVWLLSIFSRLKHITASISASLFVCVCDLKILIVWMCYLMFIYSQVMDIGVL